MSAQVLKRVTSKFVNVVNNGNANESKYYGILAKTDRKQKGFISKVIINNEEIFYPHATDFQVGNGWEDFADNKLDACIEKLIANKFIKVYEFSDLKSLFEFLTSK